MSASNAGNYGVRIGSVSQTNPEGYSIVAAEERLAMTGVGKYSVSASGGGYRGAEVTVSVDWEFPNIMGSLLSMFGGTDLSRYGGTAYSTFRQQSW